MPIVTPAVTVTATSVEMTTTTITTTTTTTTQAALTPVCSPGTDCVDGNGFEVFCGTLGSYGGYTDSSVNQSVANYQACVQLCSSDPARNGFNCIPQTSECDLYDNQDTQAYVSNAYDVTNYCMGLAER